MLARLAAACYRHRRAVVVVWLLLLVGLNVAARSAGGELLKSFSLPGSESNRAIGLLATGFDRTGDSGLLVYAVERGRVDTAAVAAVVDPVIAELGRLPHVVAVQAPGPQAVSPDGRVAFAEIAFDVRSNDVPPEVAAAMRDIVAAANTADVQIELGGSMFQERTQPKSEAIGLVAAMIILLLAFGSLLAMGLPIITALFGIGAGLALVELLAAVTDIPEFAPQVTAMIGIGVGIDYALFISTRYREALRAGAAPEAAVVHAIDTSGRAVLFAGGTVVISLLGLFAIGLSVIRGLAVGASLAVLLVMAAAVTLLPAILGFVGTGIDRFSLPGARRRQERPADRTVWVRWSRTLQARPWPAAIAGLLILVVLAAPALVLRLGVADSGNDPERLTTRRAYDVLSEGFGPGFNGPVVLVAATPTADERAAMARVRAAVAETPGVARVGPVIPGRDGDYALIRLVSEHSPQDRETAELVHRLRDDVVPAAASGSNLDVAIGGWPTAVGIDLADTVGSRLPYMFAVILVFSFVLLMLVFRSVLVPLKAVIMNLLSIGAAYGVLVAIFQWGWLRNLVGLGKEGPIEAWAPMMLFAIVFGLSMDYEVFLLSRIKEEYDQTGDNAASVAQGLAKTARLITAAAAIMICVFGSFVLSDLRVLKLVGFGLAFAVFIDATVVRLVLVPATMELLGDRNWWLPRALRWLPRVEVEGKPLVVATAADTVATSPSSSGTGEA